MVAVRVNPLDYSRASDAARRHATTLLSGVDQGSAALSRCYNMAGTDNGGESFAAAYDEAAATVMEQAYNVADGLNQWSGALISIAQIHSGTDRAVRGEEGHAPGLDSPMLPAATTGARPPSATGGDPSPIPGFDLVVDMVGYAWPNAQTGLLRDAANAWDGLASDLEAAAGHVRTLAATLASVDSPERALIETQLETFASDIDTLASAASGGEESLGHACRAYADQVDEVRDEALILLRDLALEIAAAVAASVALSFVTFGIGGVVGSAAIAARIVFVAGRIGPRFAALASRAISFAQAMRRAVASVRALGARGTIALNVVKQGTTEVITAQVTLPLFRGIVGAESRTPPALFTSFAAGGVGAAFSDLVKLGPRMGGRLGDVLGGMASGAASHPVASLLEGDEITWKGVIQSTVVSGGAGGITGGINRRFEDRSPTRASTTNSSSASTAAPNASAVPNIGGPANAAAAGGRSGPNPDFDGPQRGGSDPTSATPTGGATQVRQGDAPIPTGSDPGSAAPTGGGTQVRQGDAPVATGGDGPTGSPSPSNPTPPPAADAPTPPPAADAPTPPPAADAPTPPPAADAPTPPPAADAPATTPVASNSVATPPVAPPVSSPVDAGPVPTTADVAATGTSGGPTPSAADGSPAATSDGGAAQVPVDGPAVTTAASSPAAGTPPINTGTVDPLHVASRADAIDWLKREGLWEEPGTRPSHVDDSTWGVTLMSEDVYNAYFRSGPGFDQGTGVTLSAPGRDVWMFPIEDVQHLTKPGDAAFATGQAQTVVDALDNGGSVIGIFADLDGLSPVVPNSQMAGSNGHFLPGGRTAVTDGHGNFAILPLRELTVAGGQPMPPGSWAARLLSDGRWGVIGVFR